VDSVNALRTEREALPALCRDLSDADCSAERSLPLEKLAKHRVVRNVRALFGLAALELMGPAAVLAEYHRWSRLLLSYRSRSHCLPSAAAAGRSRRWRLRRPVPRCSEHHL